LNRAASVPGAILEPSYQTLFWAWYLSPADCSAAWEYFRGSIDWQRSSRVVGAVPRLWPRRSSPEKETGRFPEQSSTASVASMKMINGKLRRGSPVFHLVQISVSPRECHLSDLSFVGRDLLAPSSSRWVFSHMPSCRVALAGGCVWNPRCLEI